MTNEHECKITETKLVSSAFSIIIIIIHNKMFLKAEERQEVLVSEGKHGA